MNNLQAFFAQNAEQPKEVERVVSKRYKDAEGNPIKFKFKAISPERDAQIKAECTVKKTITNGPKKGQKDVEFLSGKYQNALIIESMVYPDLNSAELQDSYGVMGAENLFNKMFTPGEVIEAFLATQEANGYEVAFDELVEDAKN